MISTDTHVSTPHDSLGHLKGEKMKVREEGVSAKSSAIKVRAKIERDTH
jgi:hypothetical protein